MGILLREQNARGLAIITEMRQSFQSSMFTFVDKLVSVMEENCTCCKANGRQHCILNSSVENCETQSNLGNHAADCFETPVSNKIATRLGAAFDHEGI